MQLFSHLLCPCHYMSVCLLVYRYPLPWNVLVVRRVAGARISILISASLNGAREQEYIREAQTSRACRNASTQAPVART